VADPDPAGRAGPKEGNVTDTSPLQEIDVFRGSGELITLQGEQKAKNWEDGVDFCVKKTTG